MKQFSMSGNNFLFLPAKTVKVGCTEIGSVWKPRDRGAGWLAGL